MNSELLERLVQLDNALRELDQAPVLQKGDKARTALKCSRLLLGDIVERTLALEGELLELKRKWECLSASAPSRA